MSIKDKLKVLVVDDTSTSRGLLTQSLETIGFLSVETAADGQSALQTLHKKTVHLVLSDFFMPDMNGIQLLHHIRTNQNLKGVGFILVTGRATPEIIRSGQKLGMNNLLHKPFSQSELRTVIESVVGRI